MASRYSLRILVVLLGVVTHPALAQSSGGQSCTYVVAQDGSGDYLTIDAAAQVANDGDVVCIERGIYRETVSPKFGGDAGSGQQVTYRPLDEEDMWGVVVSGAEAIAPTEWVWDEKEEAYRWDWNPPTDGTWDVNEDGWFGYSFDPIHGPDYVQRRELLVARTTEAPTGSAPADLYEGHLMMAVESIDDLDAAYSDAEKGVYGTYYVSGGSEQAPTAIYARFYNAGGATSRMPADALPMIAARSRAFWPGFEGVGSAAALPNCGVDTQVGYLQVEGLVFRHTNNAEQQGAVCPGDLGTTLKNVAVEFTNGTGILTGNHSDPGPLPASPAVDTETGSDHRFLGVRISYNGQMGLGGECDRCELVDSEVSYNNWKGYDFGWEAGGMKLSFSNDTRIARVRAWGNEGPGIWFDIANTDNVIEGNWVRDNADVGIFVELVTVNTLIQHNVVTGTRRELNSTGGGLTSRGGSGLLIQAAADNYVYHNTFVNNEGSGIFINGRDSRVTEIVGSGWSGSNATLFNNIVAGNALYGDTPPGVPGESGAHEVNVEERDTQKARTNEFRGSVWERHVGDPAGDTSFWVYDKVPDGQAPLVNTDNDAIWRQEMIIPSGTESYKTYSQLGAARITLGDVGSWSTWETTFDLDVPGEEAEALPSAGPQGICYTYRGAHPEAPLNRSILDNPPGGGACLSVPEYRLIASDETVDTSDESDFEGTTTYVAPEATLTVDASQAPFTLRDANGDPGFLIVLGTVAGSGTLRVEGGSEYVFRPLATNAFDGDIEIEDSGSCLMVEDGAHIHFKGDVTATNGGFIANHGGTMALADDASLELTASAAAPIIDPGSIFALGHNSEIVFRVPVSIVGTDTEPVRFIRADPAQRWDDVELRADGNILEHVIFDGGKRTLFLRSKNNTLRHITSRNGWRNFSARQADSGGRSSAVIESSTFENATSDGVVAYQTDLILDGSIIRNSAEAGLWVSQADVELVATDVYHNGSTGHDGVEIYDGGWLDVGSNSQSRIEGNGRHEIRTSGSGWADLNSGYNSVCDDADTGVTGKYAMEDGSGVIYASKTWWGTDSPTSTLYSGTVYYWQDHLNQASTHDSYSEPCYSSANAGTSSKMSAPLAGRHVPGNARGRVERRQRTGQSDAKGPLGAGHPDTAELLDALREIRSALPHGADAPGGAALVAGLYGAQRRLERQDPAVGESERPTTMAVFHGLREGQGPAAERAALVVMDVALRESDTQRARALLNEHGPDMQTEQAQSEIVAITVDVLRREGRYSEAMVALNEGAARLGGGYVAVVAADIEIESAGITAPLAPSNSTLGKGSLYTTALAAPYPNPASGAVTVPVTTAIDSEVEVVVYDALGREVARLASETLAAGRHPLRLDVSSLSAGLYVVRASVASDGPAPEVFVQRLTVVR